MSKLMPKKYELTVTEQFTLKGYLVVNLDFTRCKNALLYINIPSEQVISGIHNQYHNPSHDNPNLQVDFIEKSQNVKAGLVFTDEFFIHLDGPVCIMGKIEIEADRYKNAIAYIEHIHVEIEG